MQRMKFHYNDIKLFSPNGTQQILAGKILLSNHTDMFRHHVGPSCRDSL